MSSHTIGLLQHISFSWEVDGYDFQTAPALTEESLQIDRTLKAWTASLTEEELQAFFDLFLAFSFKLASNALVTLSSIPCKITGD